VTTCGHRLSPEELPRMIPPQKCNRSVWDGTEDNHCILHTTGHVDDNETLKQTISDSDRIDELRLTRQTISDDFVFEDMGLYNSDFQNSDLSGCEFRNTDVVNSRFEGADLSNVYFGPSKRNSQGVTHAYQVDIKSNNFGSADLSDATFIESDLMGCVFECENMQSVSFIDCGLSELNFINQNLNDSDFSYSVLRMTTLKNCNLHNSTFHAAKLEQTLIAGSDLRNADLRNAIFDETDFEDLSVNQRTKIDSYLIQEFLADAYSEGEMAENEINDPRQYLHSRRDQVPITLADRYTNRSKIEQIQYAVKRLWSRRSGGELQPDFKHLKHARYRYRDLAQIFRANGEPERARAYSVREKHTKRKNALRNDDSNWLWLSLTRWAMVYGEEPTQPLRVAGFIILVSAIFYPLLGVAYVESGQYISYCLTCLTSPIEVWNTSVAVAHLSIVRLFAPTNTVIEPVGPGVVVGLFESVSGALLTAMFVFTLGRRATE